MQAFKTGKLGLASTRVLRNRGRRPWMTEQPPRLKCGLATTGTMATPLCRPRRLAPPVAALVSTASRTVGVIRPTGTVDTGPRGSRLWLLITASTSFFFAAALVRAAVRALGAAAATPATAGRDE